MNPEMPPVFSSDPAAAPTAVPTGPNTTGIPGAAPTVPSRPLKVQSSESGLIKNIVIILLSLLLVGALLLAFYFFTEYRAARTDVDAQIDTAVETAKKRLSDELEAEFEQREKVPYSVFYGPADYGELSFEYPKTWSVYIASDAGSSSSAEFKAYLHPREVQPLGNTTVHALEVTIRTEDYSQTTRRFDSNLKKGVLTSSVITVNGDQNADRYDGTLPSNFVGSAVTFKIRDKVVTLQTDAELYRDDFNNIISSIKFNL